MKKIKIFLASSIKEFRQERLELASHILKLNNTLIDRGVYLYLSSAETLPHAMRQNGLQAFYNREIRDSQFFYLIAGKAVGPRTREEFEIAWRYFYQYGTPKIYTMFLRRQSVEDSSITAFRERLQGLDHYYDDFDNVDAIKLLIEHDANEAAWKIILSGEEA